MTTTSKKCIEKCNNLLQGELSAVETYQQALEKFGSEPQAQTLREILRDHQDSASILTQNIIKMGGVCQNSRRYSEVVWRKCGR